MLLDKLYDMLFEWAFKKLMEAKLRNAVVVLRSYRKAGIWVYDHESSNVREEPFTGEIPKVIEEALRHAKIPVEEAEKGFNLTLSAAESPESQFCLKKERRQPDGVWYCWAAKGLRARVWPPSDGCHENAPDKIHVRVEV
jgi:hypothetical protein